MSGAAKGCAVDTFDTGYFFPSIVYRIQKEEFLSDAKEVHKKYIDEIKSKAEFDPIYPIYQSEGIFDPLLESFIKYVSQSSWNILFEQGYDMEKYTTYMGEMWAQELHKHGQHVEHVHNMGAQISGFYFIDAPEDSSLAYVFDPRPAKRVLGLPQKNMNEAMPASDQINFTPKAGDLILFNSWLGHGFAPNKSDDPFKFIHFNIMVANAPRQPECSVSAEVI